MLLPVQCSRYAALNHSPALCRRLYLCAALVYGRILQSLQVSLTVQPQLQWLAPCPSAQIQDHGSNLSPVLPHSNQEALRAAADYGQEPVLSIFILNGGRALKRCGSDIPLSIFINSTPFCHEGNFRAVDTPSQLRPSLAAISAFSSFCRVG